MITNRVSLAIVAAVLAVGMFGLVSCSFGAEMEAAKTDGNAVPPAANAPAKPVAPATSETSTVAASAPAAPVAPVVNDPAFHAKLKEIAATYETYGRVDDTLRMAPILCRIPAPGELKPSVARFSASGDAATHGQKLYYIFASIPSVYRKLTKEREELEGQMLVKQSWTAKEVNGDEAQTVVDTPGALNDAQKSLGNDVIRDRVIPYAKKDGKLFHAETKSSLFVIYKADAKTENTDAGWVYGTLTPDGKTVTSAGRVQSCMQCHQDAPHGRLFGLTEGNR